MLLVKNLQKIGIGQSLSSFGLNPNNIFDCIAYGAVFFMPIYIVTFIVGIFWEAVFAVVRGHEISEGAFVTTVLFALSCPPDAPLWQVALGISVGLVMEKKFLVVQVRIF